jgi:thiamine-monophosphate kinase
VTDRPRDAPLGPGIEFDRIRAFLRETAPDRPRAIRVGPGDDAAIIDAGPVALSVDLCIEDVHFRRAWIAPRDIGWRAANAALSDLAAMAARPVAVLVALAVTRADADAIADEVMRGVRDACAAHGAGLAGGDLTRSPGPLIVDVAVAGTAERPVLRSGAAPGEAVYVTGRLGAAAAAVRDWLAGAVPAAAAAAAFARPTARTQAALWLAARVPIGAMIDLSDGIAGDAAHIAAASGVRVVLETAALPVHPAAAARSDALACALAGGEDYELCFTAPAPSVGTVAADFVRTFGLPLTRVGRIEAGAGLALLDAAGEPLPELRAFDHFATGGP